MNIITDHEYHGVVIDTIPNEVYQWLRNKFGENSNRWFVKSNFGATTVYFRDQRDHTLFLLTWGR